MRSGWFWTACARRRSSRGATDAARCRRIKLQSCERDGFAAILAPAVFILFHAAQGVFEPQTFSVAPGLLSLGHCLILKRVHATEPSDRLLIKRDNALRVAAKRVFGLDLGQTLGNLPAHLSHFGVIHLRYVSDHGFAFVQKPPT